MYKTNVNLNLYKTFYDVAMCGSISKAAQMNYTSQPAISKSIKKLEEELNTILFYRTLSGVQLTAKGEELLYYVEKSFNNLVMAERGMIESENLERGKLSIGMPSNVGSFLLFDKIIDFHKKYPNIEVTIMTGSTRNLVQMLDSHSVDFIIDTAPVNVNDKSDWVVEKLLEVNYAFIAKKDSNEININSIKSLHDVAKHQLILPISGTSNRNDLDEVMQVNSVSAANVLNIHTSEMIIAAVKKDLGIGYVIENLVIDDGEIKILDIKEELPTVEIDLVYDKHSITLAPKKFLKDFVGYNF